ncbi:tRNA (adenosine(37)-N6)-threonylcarbamoyltransferase complex dimerization subunit type 1 TsaB [Noviherbaspirillum cavernae]|uniref:tRNA (Adenosine(37)-N6)-threonylcarbamoyltransferase complex dimerization subunit type 1 TsaB n=1 Tax=Noviherbaspirillum cavernae TaxID=2320862 RepID=A0A418X0K8_9BURK|nr:tRNA (adenosine(37)-N6)-threonylcarbamoyltransferase complex dimerization subunit type 1 TsaB [Noviherbaspirillum cavernae]RJG06016.1 tRNA (adenosine(37)-N6)-threonylcarbamoyltransferase complex dimerization subunit type 1 TsaB [Noviherbaspirillum cavernae]
MSTILAIETSTETASASLLHDDIIIAGETTGVHTHSQTILPMVQDLLKQAGMTLEQCDAIAFGSGPGSFTGVRTACGVAQGLAFGSDLPVVPVVTLLAMAQACREECGADNILVILDARMGEVYWAQYRHEHGWHTVLEPRLSAPSAVAAKGRVVACGNGLAAYPGKFENLAAEDGMQPHIMPHARQVARLARIAFENGNAVAARDAQPLYVRDKVAMTTVERLATRAAS